MNIRFANDAIREYSQGNFHVVNDGQAFDINVHVGAELLKAKHFLDGEWVNVFEPAPDQKPAVDASSYPDEFPGAEILAGLGYTYEETRLLTKEQLIDIKGIGPKTADAILEYEKEK